MRGSNAASAADTGRSCDRKPRSPRPVRAPALAAVFRKDLRFISRTKLVWSSSGQTKGQLDVIGYFLFHFCRIDSEITALDDEIAAQHQQVAFLIWHALAEL